MNIRARRHAVVQTALLAIVTGMSACSESAPHREPAPAPGQPGPYQPVPLPPAVSDTAAHRADTAQAPATGQSSSPGASPGASRGSAPVAHTPGHQTPRGPGWNRTELVAGVQSFVAAIDSNNQNAFWGSISSRSIRMIEQGLPASRDQVWNAARTTLSDIRNRRVMVIGGSRDSVALRIEGERMIDGVRENDPVVISLLRERGAWKVLYPGLQYPLHDLRKGR